MSNTDELQKLKIVAKELYELEKSSPTIFINNDVATIDYEELGIRMADIIKKNIGKAGYPKFNLVPLERKWVISFVIEQMNTYFQNLDTTCKLSMVDQLIDKEAIWKWQRKWQAAKNFTVSAHNADSVKDMLAYIHGIPADELTIRGYRWNMITISVDVRCKDEVVNRIRRLTELSVHPEIK